MRRTRLALTAAIVALSPLPAVAQTAPVAAVVLDPATLAEARLVVAHLVPPGVYKKIMGPMMAPIMDNIGDSMKALPLRQIAEMGGLDAKQAAALDRINIDEVMAIYDPRWKERMQLQTRGMFDAMGDFFTTIEPDIREAMAQAYASHFTLAELTNLERFFKTPSGAKFSSQYMTIASDPAMTAVMKSMMPKMIQHMPEFIAAAQKATAGLPKPRTLQELSPAEKARLAKALGVDEAKLRDPKSTL